MPKNFTPENIKQDFYNKYSNVSNYKELTIKKNNVTMELKNLFNKNVWNLKDQAQELEKKQIIEHNNIYNAFLSDVYLLDYNKQPKIKTITIKDFNDYKFNEGKTERNELNYINTFKSWINNIFIDRKTDLNFNWFILNQNETLFKLFEYRNNNNNSIETLRKDINLLMKLWKLSFSERHEIINKYKLININLSKIYEFGQKTNILTPLEQTKFINYGQLLQIRQELYNDWLDEYENTALNKYKNTKLRIKNIKSLLLSFYLLFPPLRLEAFNLKVIKDEKNYKNNDASIYIKDDNNIIIYLNIKKKGHKPIIYNLNDSVIKSFSKSNVNLLINNIVESLEVYPRTELFINSKNELYSEDGLKKMLKEITNDKNIGVNSLRSAYVSHYFNKLNKLQLERVAFLMRSSVGTLQNHYLKNDVSLMDDEPEPQQQQQQKILTEINKNYVIDEKPLIKVVEQPLIKQVEKTKNKKLSDEEQKIKHENKKEYLREYYSKNRNEINKINTENSKDKYYIRLVRELNNNVIKFENMRAATVEKWGIKYNKDKKLYYSTLSQ